MIAAIDTQAAQRPFVIARKFEAPREMVFKAWTEVDRLKQWFGPKGVSIKHAELDLRPGGTFHYCMRTADGKEMWGKWTFSEIVEPRRIDLVMSFSDEHGGITRHPFAPDWPVKMRSTTNFTEQQGGTLLDLQWFPVDPTDAEHRAFDSGYNSMQQGWTGTFDQLADYLDRM